MVIDVGRIAADSPDLAQLTAALALKSNIVALRHHLVTWLPCLASSNIASVDAEPGQRRVHIRFSSEVDLAAALAASPLLARCGSISNKSWGGAAMLCGLERHRLAELLKFSCPASDNFDPAQLLPAITTLLDQHGLQHTISWVPNSNHTERHQASRIVFYVLPRLVSLADLSATIERLHLQCTLLGSKVHVEAPNIPALSRCRTCNGLGHVAEHCPLYSGLCARLLFKKPLPHASLLALVTYLGGRGGYLASSVDTRTQHRKVTVLFDGGADMHIEALAPIIAKLDQFDADFGSLLHEKIQFVEPSHRLKECRECNQMQRVVHTCPFPEAAAPGRHPAQQRASNTSNHPRPPSSLLPSSSLVDPSDRMCREWRRKKECQRKSDGRRCMFEHSADHVPVLQPCFTMQRKGYCNKGSECKWDHSMQGAEQQEAAAQDQRAPAAPAPAAASLPAAPIPAPSARTARRRTASSREEKGDNMSDFDVEPAPAPSKPAAAAAAAASPAAAKSSNSRKGKGKTKQAAAQHAASASSLTTANAWSALGSAEEEAEREQRQDEASEALAARKASGAGSAPPPSSLSLLAPPASSPTKKKRGRDQDKEEEAESNSAPKRAQSLAASASAAASPAALSRSSTTAGPSMGL